MRQIWFNIMSVSLAMIMFFGWVNIVRADGAYVGEYIENYDSDSITLQVWLWPGTRKDSGLSATENMRLYGIDTPEKGWRAKCPEERQLSIEATSFVADILMKQKEILLDVQPTRGKFGRPLVIIYVEIKEGVRASLADMLITAGYARPFFGKGKRESWCPAKVSF